MVVICNEFSTKKELMVFKQSEEIWKNMFLHIILKLSSIDHGIIPYLGSARQIIRKDFRAIRRLTR